MSDNEIVMGRLTGEELVGPEFTLHQPCPAPAPLVVNGGHYVGCSREKGHDGNHEVQIVWGDR